MKPAMMTAIVMMTRMMTTMTIAMTTTLQRPKALPSMYSAKKVAAVAALVVTFVPTT
jgi:hypothetical protein